MNIFAHATYVGNSGYNAHCKNFFRNLSKYHDLKIRNFTIGPDWQGTEGGDPNPHGKDVNDLDKEKRSVGDEIKLEKVRADLKA